MRMFTARAASASFLSLFTRSEYGVDVKEGIVGIQVPGIPGEGVNSNKSNVILKVDPEEVNDMICELNSCFSGREMTAAEMVRRTFVSEGDVCSFKVSDDKGTRTVHVPKSDFPEFLETLLMKCSTAADLLDDLNAEAAAEAAAKAEAAAEAAAKAEEPTFAE